MRKGARGQGLGARGHGSGVGEERVQPGHIGDTLYWTQGLHIYSKGIASLLKLSTFKIKESQIMLQE